mmetsp:Transcript_4943/g.18993  ORF Transcript_4943/g.18993 Transcript_4943/m.18993 type:complete len:226 (-) Transcript_4943:413-1090(-)
MDFRAPAAPTSSFLPSFIQLNTPFSPPNASGLARNRTLSIFVHPSSLAHSPAVFLLTNASCARRRGLFSANSASSSGSSARFSSEITTLTFRKFNSSRNSFGENEACATPRRPITDTARTGWARSTSSACSQISVPASASASRNNTRAQSMATFPTPITATCASPSRLRKASTTAACVALCGPCSGSPLNHATNSLAPSTPRCSPSPGTSKRLSPLVPHASTTPW